MEINIIPKFLDEAVTPVAQSVGNTLSSIWTIAFGGIDIYAQKTHHKRIVELNKFKEELEQKVASIPEENIVEPPLHIIGPTLEASKYYFEDEDLRSMFANLIIASINIDSINKVHPSFVEIIKQLSSLDAKNIALFNTKNVYPIASYRLLQGTNSDHGVVINTHVFLENKEIDDIELQATSISNLNRVGLLSIDYSKYLVAENTYKKFEEHPIFKSFKHTFNDPDSKNTSPFRDFNDIEILKGKVDLTPLGRDFIEICIDSPQNFQQ